MARIPAELIQEIREKTDIVDYIGQYMTLQKRGQSITGSCPFHEDKNPSFSIHHDKQIFNCFSCQRKGNVFTFAMEMDGLSYPQAVLKVAEFSGVALDPQYQLSQQDNQAFDRPIYQIHTLASNFYSYYLTATQNGEPGMAYLTQRQLNQELIKEFQIGLAPDQSRLLLDYLREKGFSNDQLENSGIFVVNQSGQLVDRFRGRLIFPLKDEFGNVIGFSGRLLVKNDKSPKYLNSPETEIFHKNNLLFNLDRAKPEIRRMKQAIICEGFMDVLRLESIGVHHAVATMGTALSENHLRRLQAITKELVFLFDGDEAGQNATAKAFDFQDKFQQMNFLAIVPPGEKDPDEWVLSQGAQAVLDKIAHPDAYFDFYKNYKKLHLNLANPQEKSNYVMSLIEGLAKIGSTIEQQVRLKALAEEFDIPVQVLAEQLMRVSAQLGTNQVKDEAFIPSKTTRSTGEGESTWLGSMSTPIDFPINPLNRVGLEVKSVKAFQAEKLLLALLIHSEQAWIYLERNKLEIICYHEFAQRLFFDLERAYFDWGLHLPMDQLDDKLDGEALDLYLTILFEERLVEYDDQILIDCINRIDEAFLEQELSEWLQKVQVFSQNNQTADASEALMQVIKIKKKLAEKNNRP